MKSLIYLLVFTIMSITTGCSQSDDKGDGEITFKGTTKHNFGKVKYSGNGIHNFVFKNTGKSAVVITNVVSSCGCAVPAFPKKPVKKGETDTIQVKYNTRLVGTFAKTITVHSSGQNSPIILRIRGEVLPPDNSGN